MKTKRRKGPQKAKRGLRKIDKTNGDLNRRRAVADPASPNRKTNPAIRPVSVKEINNRFSQEDGKSCRITWSRIKNPESRIQGRDKIRGDRYQKNQTKDQEAN